jgi:hypothetical protein
MTKRTKKKSSVIHAKDFYEKKMAQKIADFQDLTMSLREARYQKCNKILKFFLLSPLLLDL